MRRMSPFVQPEPWLDFAACVGKDAAIFFPGRGDTHAMRAAKAICDGCTVRAQCLDYALEHGEHHGVWGGVSERERRRIRSRRRRGAA
jgi:WhiB family redox-sensing transcriptional regulator